MRRTKRVLILLLLTVSSRSFSQDKEMFAISDVTKATFFNPGVSYEKAIGRFGSLMGSAFINTAFDISFSSALGTRAHVSLDPALSIQYRYYYNYANRQQKGKRTAMNSLNYISPVFLTVFSKDRVSEDHYVEENRRPINSIGAVWGIQRNYKKRFSLDLSVGFGYLFTTATMQGPADEPLRKYVGQLTSLGQLNLGFWLNKVK